MRVKEMRVKEMRVKEMRVKEKPGTNRGAEMCLRAPRIVI
jgi:hypothetical protein